jgi:diadenosine tetraphosphate (Ap4A) HIT family hydrolase
MSGQQADSWKLDRIGSAERGENPTVITRMPSGFAVIGDAQFLPGYCLLLRVPRVTHLSDLPMPQRVEFLRDMSLLGEAIEAVCQPLRVNYEIAGNIDSFVHAHVIPRYDWEPPEYLRKPASHYPVDQRHAPDAQFSPPRHGDLQERLRAQLNELIYDLER